MSLFIHKKPLMLGTTMSMVKATISWSNKMEDLFYLDIKHQTSNTDVLSMFIDLFGSSSKEEVPSLV
jgi:hypothetical protein